MLILLSACATEPADWYYGEDLQTLTIDPISWDEGVYPDSSVLDDPQNPFADGITTEMKWEVLSTDCVPGFYAFATALTGEPTGENQFYTAQCLQTVYDGARIAPEDTYWAWSAAVRGYQVILDEFRDDVTYDSTGTIAYELAPLAWDAIVTMGGTPEGEEP